MLFCLIWNTNDKRVQKSNKTFLVEQLKPKIETNGKKIQFFLDLEFIDFTINMCNGMGGIISIIGINILWGTTKCVNGMGGA